MGEEEIDYRLYREDMQIKDDKTGDRDQGSDKDIVTRKKRKIHKGMEYTYNGTHRF